MDTARGPRSRFAARLALITALALAIRVAYVLIAHRDELPAADDVYYHWQGLLFAAGDWFIDPVAKVYLGENRPSAAHPPLYGMYLGLVSVLGGDTPLWHRLASCLLGTATVAVVGIVGRKLGGARVGLVAAAIAAVYPNLWINDALLMSESLYALTIAGVLWASYEYWQRPRPGAAALLGLLVALSALARAEGLLLFGLLVLPLVLLARDQPMNRRLQQLAVAGGAGLVFLGPWVGANLVRFEHPIVFGTGVGQVTAIGSCDKTFAGDRLGYWDSECALLDWPEGCDADEALARNAGDTRIPACDESIVDKAAREQGTRYLKDHLGRLPVVVAARVGRAWDVYRPIQGIELNATFERRGLWTSRAALASYFVLLVAAVYGCVRLAREKVTLLPFAALAVMISVTAAMSFGITRYRVPIDVALPILAAVGGVAVLRDRNRPPAREVSALPEPSPAPAGSPLSSGGAG